MSPKEYDQMVEHLASEIVDSAFEKTAKAKEKRIDALEKAEAKKYHKKLMNADLDRIEAREAKAKINTQIKNAKKNGDSEALAGLKAQKKQERAKGRSAVIKQLNPGNHIMRWGEDVKSAPSRAAGLIGSFAGGPVGTIVGGSIQRASNLDKRVAHNRALQKEMARRAESQKTAEEMIVDFAFEKEAGEKAAAGKVWDGIKGAVNAPGKAIAGALDKKRQGIVLPPEYDAKKYGKAKRIEAARDFANKHQWIPAAAGATALAGAGIAAAAAAKRKKAKKEEAQEKAAAYYDDAIMWKEAAANVWAYADELGEDYADEAILLKDAAEEVFDEASAQEEAAVNVYNDIEDAFAEDADYEDADEAGYEEEEFVEDDEA